MLCDVVRRRRRRRRRWAHAPVIHAASHFDQKKRVAWVPISMHTCGSFFYNYGAPLGGPSGRRSSAINDICCNPTLHDLVLAGWPPCCATSLFVVVVVVVVGRTRP